MEISTNGKEIRLTPKEFELLRYLVSHPNVPVPHMKLLQAVWGPDYGDESHYLHVYVARLRRKIEDDPQAPKHLTTEPGVGYRFRSEEL